MTSQNDTIYIEVVVYNNGREITDEKIMAALGFVGSNLERCTDTRKSVAGFIFFLCCCIICWQSRQQKSVALSIMETEYMDACLATQEAI